MEQDLTEPSQDRPPSCPPPASVCRKTQLKNKFDHRNEKKLEKAKEFAGYAKTLNPDNNFVKEQNLAL